MKPVELQVALPRTVDAASQQQQNMQKGVADQNVLAEQAGKLAQLRRQKSEKIEEQNDKRIRDQENESESPPNETLTAEGNPTHESQSEANQVEAEHPFKGHHLDIRF